MPRARSKPPPAAFESYPVELIQSWCAVSRQTAYLYKIGARKPSRQALRLFTLHREGRFLGDEWRGWRVHKSFLIDPDGNRTSRGQLYAYWIIVQLAHQLATDNGRLDDYYSILKQA